MRVHCVHSLPCLSLMSIDSSHGEIRWTPSYHQRQELERAYLAIHTPQPEISMKGLNASETAPILPWVQFAAHLVHGVESSKPISSHDTKNRQVWTWHKNLQVCTWCWLLTPRLVISGRRAISLRFYLLLIGIHLKWHRVSITHFTAASPIPVKAHLLCHWGWRREREGEREWRLAKQRVFDKEIVIIRIRMIEESPQKTKKRNQCGARTF